jgi:hypothetical protein
MPLNELRTPASRLVDVGFMTPTQTTDIAVAVTSTAVLAANLTRTYASFYNASDTPIRISLDGTAATMTDGIYLPSGWAYEMNPAAGNLTTAAVTAIHASTGTKTLCVVEGSEV